jgi:hypothetical protein
VQWLLLSGRRERPGLCVKLVLPLGVVTLLTLQALPIRAGCAAAVVTTASGTKVSDLARVVRLQKELGNAPIELTLRRNNTFPQL